MPALAGANHYLAYSFASATANKTVLSGSASGLGDITVGLEAEPTDVPGGGGGNREVLPGTRKNTLSFSQMRHAGIRNDFDNPKARTVWVEIGPLDQKTGSKKYVGSGIFTRNLSLEANGVASYEVEVQIDGAYTVTAY